MFLISLVARREKSGLLSPSALSMAYDTSSNIDVMAARATFAGRRFGC